MTVRAALAGAMALSACAPAPPSLDELRRSGYRELQRGDLEPALSQARQGRERTHALGDRPLERAFEVLEAEVLASSQRHVEALALLERGLAAGGAPDAVSVRALMTRGLVRCRSAQGAGEWVPAEADLDEAARRAAALPSAELAA